MKRHPNMPPRLQCMLIFSLNRQCHSSTLRGHNILRLDPPESLVAGALTLGARRVGARPVGGPMGRPPYGRVHIRNVFHLFLEKGARGVGLPARRAGEPSKGPSAKPEDVGGVSGAFRGGLTGFLKPFLLLFSWPQISPK